MQGHPEPQRGRTVTVRPHVRVQLSGDVFRYMKSLGYRQVVSVDGKGIEEKLKHRLTAVIHLKSCAKDTLSSTRSYYDSLSLNYTRFAYCTNKLTAVNN